MATKVAHFGAHELAGPILVRAVPQLVMQWVEQSLNQRVGILAVQFVLALLPRAIIVDVRAALRVVEEGVRGSSEVLLSMCVVAFAPFVLLVNTRTEGSFVAVEHELLERQFAVELIQVQVKSSVFDQVSDDLALFGRVGQRVVLLFLLVQRVDDFHQVAGREVVQLVWRIRVAEDDYERAVKVGRTVDFELVGERVSLELVAVTFQKQNVQSYTFLAIVSAYLILDLYWLEFQLCARFSCERC